MPLEDSRYTWIAGFWQQKRSMWLLHSCVIDYRYVLHAETGIKSQNTEPELRTQKDSFVANSKSPLQWTSHLRSATRGWLVDPVRAHWEITGRLAFEEESQMKQHRADSLWLSSGKDQTGHYTNKHHDTTDSRNVKEMRYKGARSGRFWCEDTWGLGGHSSSSQSSVRWPLLCRRMLTSFPADLRLQRELLPALARLVYLVEPLASSCQPGRDTWSLTGPPESAATSSRASFGGSQPSISSGFLDCMFCFKTKLSQNPDFFSVFNSSFNLKLVLQETKELSVGDQSS